MKLKVDLIPHDKFHKGIWLSNNLVPWYFFIETERTYKIPSDDNFYNTVDDYLIPIVKKLHKHEIPTTPSCAGHFANADYYSDVYDLLNIFTKKIKKGVIFENDEDGVKIFYRNGRYSLPWDKEEFIDEILNYQKKGVIGLVDEKDKIFNSLEEQGFRKQKDDSVTLISIYSNNEKEMKDKWKTIFNQLKYILN